MKKILLALLALVILAGGAFIVRQNLPSKRYARHLTKARLFVRERNYTAARQEYEKAFDAKGGYTPYASLEVLNFTTSLNLQDKRPDIAIANTKKFLEANPDSKEGLVMLSRLTFKDGDFETAFDAVNHALEVDPGYFPARLLLTEVRTKQGRLDLAEEQLRYLYKANPESVMTLLPLSENMLRQGRIQDARLYINAALATHPTDASARLMLLDSYLMENNADSAQAVLEAWQKADPSRSLATQVRKAQIQSLTGHFAAAESTLAPYMEAKEENLAAYFEMALMKAKQGRYDSAVKIYASMADISPRSSAQPKMLSTYLNLKAQNPAKALETLKELQINNKGADLATMTAVAYLSLGQDSKSDSYLKDQPDSVRATLQEFLDQMEPNKDFIGQWALMNYYGVLQQPRQVNQIVQELHAAWPKNKLATVLWAGQLSSQGHFAEAAKLLESVPSLAYAQQATLLSLYLKTGQKAKVLALCQKLQQEHANQKGLNLFLGDFYAGQNDRAKAAEYYEKELTVEPNNLIALNNLAWEYGINQANLEKAMPFIDRLKAKKMLDPRILDTIGWILAKNGKTDEGMRYINTALNLVPENPGFNYHMAFLYNQIGKKAEAKKYLQASLASKAVFEERKDAELLQAQQG